MKCSCFLCNIIVWKLHGAYYNKILQEPSMDKQLRRLFRNTAPICCSPNHEGRATKVVKTELFVEGAESIRLVDPRAEISRGFQLTFERCDRDSDKIQVQLQIDAQSEIARLLRVLQDRTGQQVVFNSCNGHDWLTLGESIAPMRKLESSPQSSCLSPWTTRFRKSSAAHETAPSSGAAETQPQLRSLSPYAHNTPCLS